MGSFIFVVFQPVVQILLKTFQTVVEFLAERDLVEVVQDRLLEALADPIREVIAPVLRNYSRTTRLPWFYGEV